MGERTVKEFCKEAIPYICDKLTIPDELIEKTEEIDPTEVVQKILEQHLPNTVK